MIPLAGARPFLALAGLAVASCGEPDVALKPFNREPQRDASVATVTIVTGVSGVSEQQVALLQNELVIQSGRCAQGGTGLDMIVQLHDFERVRADVRLVDPVRNVMVAANYIEADRPGAFAQRVCRHLFAN